MKWVDYKDGLPLDEYSNPVKGFVKIEEIDGTIDGGYYDMGWRPNNECYVYIPGGYSSDIIIESTDPEILNIYWLDETDE
jgi:hypothetical protein